MKSGVSWFEGKPGRNTSMEKESSLKFLIRHGKHNEVVTLRAK